MITSVEPRGIEPQHVLPSSIRRFMPKAPTTATACHSPEYETAGSWATGCCVNIHCEILRLIRNSQCRIFGRPSRRITAYSSHGSHVHHHCSNRRTSCSDRSRNIRSAPLRHSGGSLPQFSRSYKASCTAAASNERSRSGAKDAPSHQKPLSISISHACKSSRHTTLTHLAVAGARRYSLPTSTDQGLVQR